MLIDASLHSRHKDVRHIPAERGAEWSPRLFWHPAAGPFPEGAPTVGDPLQAYANHGRWVIDCPDCGSAQLACRTDPRFLCAECGNFTNGQAWRPVEWPADVAGIEQALRARHPRHRHWKPTDTVADLVVENAAHGVPA